MKQSAVRQPYEAVEVIEAAPTRRAQSKLRTRHKVLDAARALFIERGYEAATVRDIARRAGMSTGAVFANFQDKSDLFDAVVVDDYERVAELMREAANAHANADVATRLTEILSAGYGYYAESLPLVQATVAQSWLRPLNAELAGRAAFKVLLGVIGDALRDASRKTEVRQDFDVRLASEMLWDAYLSNFRKALFDSWSQPALRRRIGDQVELVLEGLRVR